MANSISVTTSYSQNFGIGPKASNSYAYTMSGSGAGSKDQFISGVSVALNAYLGLGTFNNVFIDNMNDASGYISVSLNQAQTQQFALIGPGQSASFPTNTTGIWVSGVAGASVYIGFAANEN